MYIVHQAYIANRPNGPSKSLTLRQGLCHPVLPIDELGHQVCKAYIPLRRKNVALGPGVGLAPQRHYFALGIPTCWYLKMLKFAFSPTQNIKFAFPQTRNPNASQWNIGCVGSLALGLCVGHVHFIFFVLISFALGSRRKRSFQWNMGLMVFLWEIGHRSLLRRYL